MSIRTHLKVFVASANDVTEERECLPAVIERVNGMLSGENDPVLDLWRWETNAVPGFHVDGVQALINPDLDTSDIAILIVWNRIGPGATAELRRSVERWQRTDRPLILPYFSQRPSVLESEEALEDRLEVLRTRRMLEQRGLVAYYSDIDELRERLERDLCRAAHRLTLTE